MQSTPDRFFAEHRSSRMDTEPGLISTRRIRRSRGTAEALSLLPEHSPSKKRRTEASSCIVGVWINRANPRPYRA